jgi:hypothetical protein
MPGRPTNIAEEVNKMRANAEKQIADAGKRFADTGKFLAVVGKHHIDMNGNLKQETLKNGTNRKI